MWDDIAFIRVSRACTGLEVVLIVVVEKHKVADIGQG